MKTLELVKLLLLIFYVIPSIAGLIRLWNDPETNDSLRNYLKFFYWALVPIFNLVLLYFMLREFKIKVFGKS